MKNEIFLQTFIPFSKTQDTDYEAKAFIEVGRQALKLAETEIKFGNETRNAFSESEQPKANLAKIALWHYEKGLERIAEAVLNFEQAKRFSISKKYQKYIELKLKKCLEKTDFTVTCKTELVMA